MRCMLLYVYIVRASLETILLLAQVSIGNWRAHHALSTFTCKCKKSDFIYSQFPIKSYNWRKKSNGTLYSFLVSLPLKWLFACLPTQISLIGFTRNFSIPWRCGVFITWTPLASISLSLSLQSLFRFSSPFPLPFTPFTFAALLLYFTHLHSDKKNFSPASITTIFCLKIFYCVYFQMLQFKLPRRNFCEIGRTFRVQGVVFIRYFSFIPHTPTHRLLQKSQCGLKKKKR